jgi:hypothetical protein
MTHTNKLSDESSHAWSLSRRLGKTPRGCLLVWVCLGWFLHSPVEAHTSGPMRGVEMIIHIEETTIQYQIRYGSQEGLRELLHTTDEQILVDLSEAEIRKRVSNSLKKHCAVMIDGIAVQPHKVRVSVESLEEMYSTVQELRVKLDYESKRPIRTAGFVWKYYPKYDTLSPPPPFANSSPSDTQSDSDSFDENSMAQDSEPSFAAELFVDGTLRLLNFNPEEPEYIWHADGVDAASDRPAGQQATVRPRTFPLPALSMSLLAMSIVTVFFVKGKRRRLVTLAVGVLVAGATCTLWTVHIDTPFERSVPTLNASQAVDTFETLLANIYRAFDYTRESDVYDTLAVSVDGPMLSTIYTDIYNSLILRAEGGAVCRVESVNIHSADLLPAVHTQEKEPGAYSVRCSWQIDGLVKHWGHTHRRSHAFEAIYTVAPRDEVWKIIDVDVLRQDKIGSDE